MQKIQRLLKSNIILKEDKKEFLIKYKNKFLYFYTTIIFKLYTIAYYYYYK